MGRKTRFSQIWTTEAGLTALLISILLLFIALYPLSTFAVGQLLVLIFFSLLLVSGVMTVFDHPTIRILVGGLAVVALTLLWMDRFLPGKNIALAGSFSSFLFLALLVTVTLTRVFQTGQITFHRICGAVAAYLLIGTMWASLYQFIVLSLPGAIALPPMVDVSDPEAIRPHLFYFSFVTLTTLGYGDIIPVHPAARLVVMLEALTGQLYPAITLAWLVSMQILHRDRRS
jgi:voltage-gated potassium channel Kch